MTNKQYPPFSRKDLVLVTFGHRNAKGDLRTPQNLLLFFVEDRYVVFLIPLHLEVHKSYNISLCVSNIYDLLYEG